MLTVDHKLLGVREGDQILDVGCGTGRHSWGFYKQIDCAMCAVDLQERDLKKTAYTFDLIDQEEQRPGKWLAVRGDATALPIKDASFEKVVCSEVLEHVHDDGRAVGELVRVLKADGVLAVSVPARFCETIYWKISRDYHNYPGCHVRIYKAGQLMDLLRQHDLRVYAVRRKHSLHSLYWLLRCIFGVNNEKALVPRLYHGFLVWDLKTRSRPIRLLDDVCNRLFPKSIVVYARKGEDAGHS